KRSGKDPLEDGKKVKEVIEFSDEVEDESWLRFQSDKAEDEEKERTERTLAKEVEEQKLRKDAMDKTGGARRWKRAEGPLTSSVASLGQVKEGGAAGLQNASQFVERATFGSLASPEGRPTFGMLASPVERPTFRMLASPVERP